MYLGLNGAEPESSERQSRSDLHSQGREGSHSTSPLKKKKKKNKATEGGKHRKMGRLRVKGERGSVR